MWCCCRGGAKKAMKKQPRYIFVVGGVISGVGKGVTASSIAKILQDRGLVVTAVKIDPYVNIDAGTMNPTEHGEVFVLSDGDECDQDMGNYERFLHTNLSRTNYMTTGRVYQSVIEQERALKYKGACVQVVPHVPLEIVARIEAAQQAACDTSAAGGKKEGKSGGKQDGKGITKPAGADVVVVEIGGTVGEYENILFLEAARMMKARQPNKVMTVMVSYLPTPATVGEMKTKPTQHSVRLLQASGIQPDIIIARSSTPLDAKRREKLSFFCNIAPDRVIAAPDIASIYEVPINFEKAKLSDTIGSMLGLKFAPKVSPAVSQWKKMVQVALHGTDTVRIAMVGKYFETGDFVLSDAYISVIEALKFSAFTQGKKVDITWVSAERFEEDPASVAMLADFDGVVVPGGFGSRGIEGKIMAIQYVREQGIPYLGLCYGMQLAVIEYARHVAGIAGATSRELVKGSAGGKGVKAKAGMNGGAKSDVKSSATAGVAVPCVIDLMDTQQDALRAGNYGNTMRLGAYEAVLKPKSMARALYGTDSVVERHRHRYEVNPLYVEQIAGAGLVFSGTSPDGSLMEIIELPKTVHPFFMGVQFHPEFLARPLAPHPLFSGLVKAAVARRGK